MTKITVFGMSRVVFATTLFSTFRVARCSILSSIVSLDLGFYQLIGITTYSAQQNAEPVMSSAFSITPDSLF